MAPKVLAPAHVVVPPYSTCISLKLPRNWVCSVCSVTADPLIHKRQPKKTKRCKSERNWCKELRLRSNYTSHLTPGEKLLDRLQCRFLGCDFVKDGEKPTKEHLTTSENVSKESESILDETKQPSLDDSTAPT